MVRMKNVSKFDVTIICRKTRVIELEIIIKFGNAIQFNQQKAKKREILIKFSNILIQLRRPLTVTECGSNCWSITESPLFIHWAVGSSYDGSDNIMYHGQTEIGRAHV